MSDQEVEGFQPSTASVRARVLFLIGGTALALLAAVVIVQSARGSKWEQDLRAAVREDAESGADADLCAILETSGIDEPQEFVDGVAAFSPDGLDWQVPDLPGIAEIPEGVTMEEALLVAADELIEGCA